jgi:hypothetical protein
MLTVQHAITLDDVTGYAIDQWIFAIDSYHVIGKFSD